MFYITGDIHGEPQYLILQIKKKKLKKNDTVIIVGDCGFNYFNDYRDKWVKERTKDVPCTFFCIQGNHEGRPHHYPSYQTKEFCGGTVWYEKEYPNLLFAKDGEIYQLDGKFCLVLGGAYSVDKYYRLVSRMQREGEIDSETFYRFAHYVNHQEPEETKKEIDEYVKNKPYGWAGWFYDEQISDEDMKRAEQQLKNKIDFIFSHTCPFRHEPTEMFLPQVNQDAVDKRMERWLDSIEDKCDFQRWYCGHWHTDKSDGKFRFLYHNLIPLGE